MTCISPHMYGDTVLRTKHKYHEYLYLYLELNIHASLPKWSYYALELLIHRLLLPCKLFSTNIKQWNRRWCLDTVLEYSNDTGNQYAYLSCLCIAEKYIKYNSDKFTWRQPTISHIILMVKLLEKLNQLKWIKLLSPL